VSFLRPLLALAVVLGACWFGMTSVEHHAREDANAEAFDVLYEHLMPAPLVVGGHGESAHGEATHGEAAHTGADESHGEPHYLLSLPVPGAPAFLDRDAGRAGVQIVATNLQLFQVAAVLLVLICFSGAASHARKGGGDWLSRRAAGFAMWVRDEMVYPAMGPALGARFLPWFLTLFFFILFMNLLGLVPGSATATSNIFVTAALAVITFLSMVVCGMVAQGPIAFWKNLVPHVPLALWPLMFVVELIGLLVKPFALMVRLFANMTGGHMVVLSFMGLIFFFAGTKHSAMGYAVSPIAVGFAVFIMIIESFVALLQAYIFTQLSILFVGASVHPEH
jgi:F-type H+-transporting ATPase subunit a